MIKKSDGINITLHKIYSEDGIELDSILFEPKKKTKKIIIHVHGKEGNFIQNHFVNYMGNSYPLNGYSFLTFNNRGHDYIADLLKKTSTGFVWEQGGSVFDILENSQYDIQGVVNYVGELGYEEIILQGHSLGPHKICYYLVNRPNNNIAKIILLTTADVRYQFDSSVPNWQKYAIYAKKLIDKGRGRDLMPIKLWSNCLISADSFWNYTRPDNNCFVFNGTHSENEFKNFNKVTLPLLVVNPENDVATGINPQKMIGLLTKRTISKEFKGYIIKNAVHNFLSKEEELIEIIIDWLKRYS